MFCIYVLSDEHLFATLHFVHAMLGTPGTGLSVEHRAMVMEPKFFESSHALHC